MEKQKHITHFFRALLVIVAVLVFSEAVLAEDQVKPTASFYFVQITDTHWDDGDNFERTRKAVEQINSLSMPIKCVIHTGDITYEKTEDETVVMKGLAILRELKAPIHFVPGNHDILRSRYAITRDAYIKYFGSLVTEVEYDGVVFIMIYTEPFVLTGGGPGNATTFLSQYLTQKAVGQFDLGPAAAFSLIYFLIILLLCFILYNWMQRVGTADKTEAGHA